MTDQPTRYASMNLEQLEALRLSLMDSINRSDAAWLEFHKEYAAVGAEIRARETGAAQEPVVAVEPFDRWRMRHKVQGG